MRFRSAAIFGAVIAMAAGYAGEVVAGSASRDCLPGRFLPTTGLITGRVVQVDATGMVSVDGWCEPKQGQVQAKRRKMVVRGRWKRCGDSSGVRIRAVIDESDCALMRGTIRARGAKPASFAARKSRCDDGVVDVPGGEECEPSVSESCTAGFTCTGTCRCEATLVSLTTTTTATTSPPTSVTSSTLAPISGRVTDRGTGAPIAGVRLWRPDGIPWGATTDQDGRYAAPITDPYDPPRYVNFTAPGYFIGTTDLWIHPDVTLLYGGTIVEMHVHDVDGTPIVGDLLPGYSLEADQNGIVRTDASAFFESSYAERLGSDGLLDVSWFVHPPGYAAASGTVVAPPPVLIDVSLLPES